MAKKNERQIQGKWGTVSDIHKVTMLEALEKSMGIVTQALILTGNHIVRSTHYDWMDNDPAYRQQVELLGEKVIDMAETALYQLVSEKNPSTVQFFMKTKGRKRGYQERVEHTGKDGAPLFDLPPEKESRISSFLNRL
jgi:hypothetical protein